jgi:putative hydrolase of the HAD superfamily
VTVAGVRAVIFDLGGTLVDWPGWDEDAPRRWSLAYEYAQSVLRGRPIPDAAAFIRAMRAAELAHWRRVEMEQASQSPSEVVREGFRNLGIEATAEEIAATLDGYGRAVRGWSIAFPDARATLAELRGRGYRIGLLSNTWWAPEWHNADLELHGLAELLDVVAYTSALPRSKPHPSVFREVADRLGVEARTCAMVGDRTIDDVAGALGAGMRAVWKANDRPWPRPAEIVPTATITALAELPSLFREWGGP